MMDQKTKVDDIFARFHKPSIIFKDRDAMRATYVPDNLPHRDAEISSLANILGPIMGGGTPSNAFLYGKTGGGKTVVTKYVLGKLKENTDSVNIAYEYAFLNCSIVDTSYRLYSTLCDVIGVTVPKTGLPTNDIFTVFREKLDELNIHMTIVLDEIDLLMKKAGDTLYALTRVNSDLEKSRVSLIGITNNVQFKETIDARVRSTLTEQELIFPPYSANQLQDIIEERARLGFSDDVLEKSAILKAAALAASEHGDARRALDLIRVAGEVADANGDPKVTSEHVTQASDVIERKIVKEVIHSLPIQSKAVVYTIAMLDAKRRRDPREDHVNTGQVFEAYVKTCTELGLDPLTQRRVGDLINELDLLGMISATVVSKGRYGRTRMIHLAVHPSEIHKGLTQDKLIGQILPPLTEWTA